MAAYAARSYSPTYVLGHETSATSYANGNAYTIRHKNFNKFGKSTGTIVSIPTAEGTQLGKTWTRDHTYTPNIGLPWRDIYPLGGGLPAETVTRVYDGLLNLPVGLGGLAGYAQSTSYDAYWRITQTTIGASPNTAALTYTRHLRPAHQPGHPAAVDPCRRRHRLRRPAGLHLRPGRQHHQTHQHPAGHPDRNPMLRLRQATAPDRRVDRHRQLRPRPPPPPTTPWSATPWAPTAPTGPAGQ